MDKSFLEPLDVFNSILENDGLKQEQRKLLSNIRQAETFLKKYLKLSTSPSYLEFFNKATSQYGDIVMNCKKLDDESDKLLLHINNTYQPKISFLLHL